MPQFSLLFLETEETLSKKVENRAFILLLITLVLITGCKTVSLELMLGPVVTL